MYDIVLTAYPWTGVQQQVGVIQRMHERDPSDGDSSNTSDAHRDGGRDTGGLDTTGPPSSGADQGGPMVGSESEEDEIEWFESQLEEERQRNAELRKAVDDLTAVVSANADGDLTRSPGDPPTSSARALYSAYDELLAEWRDTVDRMASFGEQVSSATDSVETSIESVQTASREVSEAVDEISSGANQQSEFIQGISDEMRSLSATTEEIAASATEAAETSSEAARRGETAESSANEAVAELEALTDRAEDTVENVERLEELTSEIEDVVDFITDVADQTNILALNANIEAARAGEEGAGFSVVASEVKDLASETKTAAAEIGESLDRVHDQVEATAEEIHRTSDTVETTRGAVEQTVDQLDEMVGRVMDVDASVQEIEEVTETQARSTQEVVTMVDEVGEISNQTSAEADVAAGAASNQTTELTEASSQVSTLADRASMLEQTLADFDISGRETAARSDDAVVDFWHAMGGEKALLLEELAREFESETEGIRVSLTSKGDYRGTLDATISAAERGDPPAIAQIFEIGSTRARESNQFQPVEELLDPGHINSLLDPVTNYYRFNGTLHSVPFNSSNPVLAYNREAFEAAGLDPNDPPATWDEVVDASERLVANGPTEYGITFANYSWFVEQWFAEADELLVDARNGRAGTPTEAYLDGGFARSLYEWWADMENSGLYDNPGIEARGAAKDSFHDGEAAMLIGSTSSLTSIESGADFPVGAGQFPVRTERTGVLIGGASLWVGDDLSGQVREAVGEFITWLTEPEQQKRWHRETGYFPIHENATAQLREEGWFEQNPHYGTAFRQLMETTDTMATRGAQIGPFDRVRTIIEEGFERVDTTDDVPAVLDDVDTKVGSALQSW